MNLVKKMTIYIFVILTIFPCVPVGVFAAKVPPLDTSDVIDDLEGLKLGDVAFDEANYPLINGAEPELLGIYEYGWDTELYSLYFYIYNPDVKNEERDYYSTVDFNFFVYKDTLDAASLSLWLWNEEPIDQSDDGRFLKFKVDGDRFVSFFSSASTRIYAAEIDMRYYDLTTEDPYSGNCLSVQIDVSSRGETFHFRDKGGAVYHSGETISLEVNPSMYKTDFSPKGDYWHQMIYTAYFTIPKKYVENYDALTGIEATWEEYHTAPLVVTENDVLLSVLTGMAADKALDDKLLMGQINHNYGAIISEYFVDSYNGTPTAVAGNKTINTLGLNNNPRGDLFYYDVPIVGGYTLDCEFNSRFSRFDTALKVSDIDDFFIPTIGRYYDTDGDGIGDLAATFQNSVDEGRLLGKNTHVFTSEKDIISVDKRFDDNWIRSFWNSILKLKDVEVTLPPFYYLKDSDMAGYSRNNMNENLFIGERFWGDFYDEYAKAKLTGDQVVLFRFALRDYYSAPARYIDGETYTSLSDAPNCALSYGTAFLDFDIIKLTFSDDGIAYVFDVDADPIDFVPGGANPNTPGAGIGAAADDLLSKILSIIETFFKIVVGIVAVVVIVTLINWLLTWLALRRR